MKYCKKCVQPDTRPGIVFDAEGVCAACRFSEQMQSVDWDKRERELKKIAEWAKKNSGGGFDCISGVSGGRDSHYQSLYLKERLGLRVLLVNMAPDNITEAGRHNLENLVQQGFDLISFRSNPKVWRAAARKAFFEYGNPVKPSEYMLYAVSYQAALAFGIPLVVQGDNAAIVLGTLDELEADDDALNVDQYTTLGGGNASDWVQEGIELKDLLFYQFPDKDELRKKVRAIFLNYYVKEWSYAGNTEFAVSRGLRGREGMDPNMTGRLNPYGSVDSDMLFVNQMLKYYKFGFGCTTDEVCYEIREGRLSREEAIKLVEQYDGKCDARYIRRFCEYIGITVEEFWPVFERFVNRKLFRKNPAAGEKYSWTSLPSTSFLRDKWQPLFKVGYGLISE